MNTSAHLAHLACLTATLSLAPLALAQQAPDDPEAAAQLRAGEAQAEALYTSALNAMREQDYAAAREALNALLESAPGEPWQSKANSRLAEIATYEAQAQASAASAAARSAKAAQPAMGSNTGLEVTVAGGATLMGTLGDGVDLKLFALPYANFFTPSMRLGYWVNERAALNMAFQLNQVSAFSAGLGLLWVGGTLAPPIEGTRLRPYASALIGSFFSTNDGPSLEPFVGGEIGVRLPLNPAVALRVHASDRFFLSELSEYVAEVGVGLSLTPGKLK